MALSEADTKRLERMITRRRPCKEGLFSWMRSQLLPPTRTLAYSAETFQFKIDHPSIDVLKIGGYLEDATELLEEAVKQAREAKAKSCARLQTRWGKSVT